MRLVDLLLTPRQTTSLHPYGGQSRDGPIWMTQAPPPRRSPVHTTTHQIADNLPVKTNPRYYNPHDSPVTRQVAQSSRSVGALSDLLRSTRSPTASGYRNHSTMTPNSQCVTTELSRLLQQQDSIHPETVAPDNDGSHHLHGGRTTQEGSGAQIRKELVTLDKNLNCTIWKNEGVFRTNSSSSSSASLSSSSSSSSKSSIGEPNRVPYGRRVSLLSSDGSDLDPRDHILSTMVDSDSHESLSSPLEEMEASRWMDQAASAGYGDWQNLEEGQERENYDIFDTYPLFNFNILGNTLEGADSPFTPLDGNYLLTSDDNIAFGNDSLVAMVPGVTATSMATDPSKVEAGLMQVSSGCHDYNGCHDFKPYGMNSITENMFQAQLSLSNGAIRHQNNNNNSNIDDMVFVSPSYSSSVLSGATDNEPRSTTSPPQSEVVKLLLQNRRQWAPPAEKLPPHGGYRGSRKRAQGSSARETTRAKAPRSSRLVPLPSERRHSVPSLTRKATPFVSTTSLNLEDDQSASLERLITELILLESENACSGNPSDPNSDNRCSTWASLPAKQEPDVEKSSSFAEELFEGLIVCPTSESDLFSNLELESIYSGDCTELLALQEASRFQESIEGFNVVIKSDPEKAESPPSPYSAWNQDCVSFPVNGYSRKTATQYEQMQNRINGKADVEATALEGVLQSKLFLDSPPPVHSESGFESPTRSDQAIIDHDYCQTDNLPTDDCNVEPAWLSKRRKHSKCCLSRGATDYSALKSLLLDSNLPEEVRKEAELDRAKSMKNMSEKRSSPVIAEPLRALNRCGKGVSDDDDNLLSHLSAEGESPLRLLYKNLTALTGGQLSLKGLFEQLLSSDETSNLDAEDVERNTDTSDGLSTVSGSSDPCPNPQAVTVVKREDSEDVAVELSAPLASHLDLCSDEDIENAIFFDSFEEFYSSSSQDLEESATELQVEEHPESSPESLTPPSESSRLSTNTINRWNFKKPRSRCHSLKKRTSRLAARTDATRTKALRSGQLIRKQSTQAVTPLVYRERNARMKPVFVEKQNGKLQAVE